MTSRAERLVELASRAEGIDAERRRNCEAITREEYEKLSAVPSLARIAHSIDEAAVHGWTRISDSPSMTTAYFNAPDRWWDSFARELAREVAVGEKSYLFTQIASAAPSVGTIARVHPDFGALEAAIDQLSGQGFNPDAILLPIELSTEFTRRFCGDIEWLPQRILHARGHALTWHVSSRGVPLSRLIVFDTAGGVWNVITDPVTGSGRLTSTIGRIEGPFDNQIGWIVETAANYAIENPSAFAGIDLEKV